MAKVKAFLMASVVVTLWGSSFVLTRIALDEVGPVGIAFYRWFWAALFFALFLGLHRRLGEIREALKRDLLPFTLLGLIGITLFYVFQNLGVQYSTAVNVGLIINLVPVFIAILSVIYLRERIGALTALGIFVAFLGVSLVGWQKGPLELSSRYFLGDLLTVLAALCGAIYTVWGKRVVARYAPLVVTALAAGFGALFLFPLALAEGLVTSASPQIWLTILALGLGGGALANLWWWIILETTEASRAGAYLLTIPVISTLLGILVLHEPFAFQSAIGAALVLGGVALTQRTTGAI
jgi:drug/metabolite transporter (DMT)-like permease